jgi:hypothetical protein
MNVGYEGLTPGYEFPPASYELSASLISKYLKAVDSSSVEFVPPLAIAAYAMTDQNKEKVQSGKATVMLPALS